MNYLLLPLFVIGLNVSVFSQNDCIDPTSLNYNSEAILDCSGIEGGDDISCCAYYSICLNTCFSSYNSDIRKIDCLGVVGGSDFSCCFLESDHSMCCGAEEILEGIEMEWNNSTASTSEYTCSPILHDLWYEFVPTSTGVYSIEVDADFHTAFSIWQGECLGEFHSTYCISNNALEDVASGTRLLIAGEVYFIQIGGHVDSPFLTFGFGVLNVELLVEEFLGCTDPEACNYDELATVDDSSCGYPGNSCYEYGIVDYYSYNENCDCLLFIPGDFTGDGAVTIADLGPFLSVFGTGVFYGHPGDFTNDGYVTVSDITGFLLVFGVPVE